MLLLVPFAASDALVVPSDLLRDAGHAHGPVRDPEHPGGVLDRVIVGPDSSADIQCKRQDGTVHRGQPGVVTRPACRLVHPLEGLLREVGDTDHVPPEGEARIAVALQLPDDSRRAHMLLLGQGVHGEECGAVQNKHGRTKGDPRHNALHRWCWKPLSTQR